MPDLRGYVIPPRCNNVLSEARGHTAFVQHLLSQIAIWLEHRRVAKKRNPSVRWTEMEILSYGAMGAAIT